MEEEAAAGGGQLIERRRGFWTEEEDGILREYIKVHGKGKWNRVAKLTELKRSGKSCRLRWINYLNPGIKRGNFSEEEDDLIIRLHNLLGNRWSLIAGRVPGRTDNQVKNHWNTHLRTKLGMTKTSNNNISKQTRRSRTTKQKIIRSTNYSKEPSATGNNLSPAVFTAAAATTPASNADEQPPKDKEDGIQPFQEDEDGSKVTTTQLNAAADPPRFSSPHHREMIRNNEEEDYKFYYDCSSSSPWLFGDDDSGSGGGLIIPNHSPSPLPQQLQKPADSDCGWMEFVNNEYDPMMDSLWHGL